MYFDYKRIGRSTLFSANKLKTMIKSVSMLLRIVLDRGRNFSRRLKVACVVKIKWSFMDWFYYNLIILIT